MRSPGWLRTTTRIAPAFSQTSASHRRMPQAMPIFRRAPATGHPTSAAPAAAGAAGDAAAGERRGAAVTFIAPGTTIRGELGGTTDHRRRLLDGRAAATVELPRQDPDARDAPGVRVAHLGQRVLPGARRLRAALPLRTGLTALSAAVARRGHLAPSAWRLHCGATRP